MARSYRYVSSLCKLCTFLLCFIFFILKLGRNVGGENRKHHHPQRGKEYRKYLTDRGYRVYIRPDGSHVHKGPPQSVPVCFYQRIYGAFQRIENNARKIDKGKQRRDVGREQVGNPAAGHPPDHDDQPVCPPNQRDRPHGNEGDMGHVYVERMRDVEKRDRNHQEQEVMEKEPPPLRAAIQPYEKIQQENNAYPKLDFPDEIVVVRGELSQNLQGKHKQDGETADQD